MFLYRAKFTGRRGRSWEFERISLKAFRNLKPEERREILANVNAAMSKIVSDFTINMNQGWHYVADITRPDRPPRAASRLIEGFLKHLDTEWAGLDTTLSEIADSFILEGASFTELVFDDTGRIPRRIVTLSPTLADWQQRDGPDGVYWELGQRHSRTFRDGSNFKSLHGIPEVRWTPFFPTSTMPWGRNPVDSAMRDIVAKEELTANLQRYVGSTAWPSILFTIDIEDLKTKLGNTTNKQEIQTEIIRLREQINTDFKQLGPASAMVYSSDVGVGSSLSGLSRQNLAYASDMIRDLDRDIVTGGKSASILHNRQEGIAERHAMVQLIGYERFVRRGQRIEEGLLSYYLNLALIRNNLPGLARFYLSPATREEQKDMAEARRTQAESQISVATAYGEITTALQSAVTAEFMTPEAAQETFQRFVQNLTAQDTGMSSDFRSA